MPARSTSEATSTRDPTARRGSSTWKDPNLERRATGIAGDQDRSRRRRRNRNLPKHGVPIGVREQFRRRAQSPMARRPVPTTTGVRFRENVQPGLEKCGHVCNHDTAFHALLPSGFFVRLPPTPEPSLHAKGRPSGLAQNGPLRESHLTQI